jgi:hypothetical protein
MRNQAMGRSGSDQLRHSSGGGSDLTQRNYNTIAGNLLGNGGFTPNPDLAKARCFSVTAVCLLSA